MIALSVTIMRKGNKLERNPATYDVNNVGKTRTAR